MRFQHFPRILGSLTALMTMLSLAVAPTVAHTYLNAQMPWHEVVLDSQGRVLAWYHPEKHLGYDQFLRLGWDFLEHKAPIDTTTEVKVYLTASMFDESSYRALTDRPILPARFFILCIGNRQMRHDI